MKWITSALTKGINITIKDRSAQLLLSAAIFILAMGIAWSFIRGTSWVKYDKKPKENVEELKIDKQDK